MEKKSFPPRIEIDMTFDQQFACSKEFSNKEFSFNIENLNGVIAFPKIDPNIDRISCFKKGAILPPDNADLSVSRHKEINWGSIPSFPFSCIRVGNLRAWVNVLDEDNYKNEGNFLYDHLPKWRDLLQLYLEIFTKESLRYREPIVSPINKYINMSIWANENGKSGLKQPFDRIDNINIEVGEHPCIDEQAFFWVLDRLQRLEPPPVEYQLLNEARIDFQNRNLAKAIIQASTAIEIVLEKLISEIIENKIGKDFLKVLGQQTLGKKYHTLKGLGIDLSTLGYSESFVGVRNAAAHKGNVPEKLEVRQLIQSAEKILEHFSPLMSSLPFKTATNESENPI
ncbi:MAG: hypothetical protein ACKVU0_10505 [Saprospiraceae bacterium]